MVSTAPDDDEMDAALAEIERKIISGLHELGESGTEELGSRSTCYATRKHAKTQ